MAQQIKAINPSVLQLSVLRNEPLSHSVRRITVGGDDLHRFTPTGGDQWFRMFFPREGQDQLWLPSATSHLWYAQYLAANQKVRSWVRNYTVRAFRSGKTPELDIDMLSHGDSDSGSASGPASLWASRASAGDRLGILDQGRSYNPHSSATEQLLIADETGLPAIMSILESGPVLPTRAIVEIPEADDAQPLPASASHVDITWLPRKDSHAKPGLLALAAVKSAPPPAHTAYAFAVGEQSLATGARRYLVNEAGVPKSNISFVGYWRHGQKGHG